MSLIFVLQHSHSHIGALDTLIKQQNWGDIKPTIKVCFEGTSVLYPGVVHPVTLTRLFWLNVKTNYEIFPLFIENVYTMCTSAWSAFLCKMCVCLCACMCECVCFTIPQDNAQLSLKPLQGFLCCLAAKSFYLMPLVSNYANHRGDRDYPRCLLQTFTHICKPFFANAC